jgi:anti-sigma B factor antagonist
MRVSPEGETGLIQLYGEFDLASAEAVDRELRRSEESVAGTVVVDLSGLDFIDSSGIAVLAHAADRASKNESRFGLRRGNAQVERTFELAGLSELLPFLD